MPTIAAMPPVPKPRHLTPATRIFVAITTLALALCAAALMLTSRTSHSIPFAWFLALLFGSAVVALRAATLPAALCGMLIAFITWKSAGIAAFTGLFVLFVTTWIATKIGRARKQKLGTAEGRRGRRASQVLANLAAFGVLLALSALVASPGSQRSSQLLLAGAAAALAEAAGDTVSSEIGQVYGGTPFMITSFRPVPAGTDGGITLVGTAAGIGASALVLAVWALPGPKPLLWMFLSALGAVAGILFDSLLGSTLERKGYLGNDGVNFASTLFAAGVTMALFGMIY